MLLFSGIKSDGNFESIEFPFPFIIRTYSYTYQEGSYTLFNLIEGYDLFSFEGFNDEVEDGFCAAYDGLKTEGRLHGGPILHHFIM